MTERAPEPYDFVDGYLGATLLDQAGEISELSRACDEERERSDRFDEGLCAMQWTLSRLPHASAVAVPVAVVLQMAHDAVRYGQTGARSEWIDAALEEVRG